MMNHSEISEQDPTRFQGEVLAGDAWARLYGVRIVLGFVSFFPLFLIAMYLAGQMPGQSLALKSGSDIFQCIGGGIGCWFCVRVTIRLHKTFAHLRSELIAKEVGNQVSNNLDADRAEARSAFKAYLAWMLITIAVALYVVGLVMWAISDISAGSASAPFPSLYDLDFVASYPFFLLGTLLLTRQGKAIVRRTYLLLDALAVIGASLALSWFFLLGPSIAGLARASDPGAAFLSLYFPTGDLFLVAVGAFLMFSPLSHREQQPVFLLLCSGLFILAIGDSLLGYYNFSGGFNTGTFQDVFWPVSMQLIGLAAITYPDSIVREQEQREEATGAISFIPHYRGSQLTAIALTILPLILVLMTCALLLLHITPQGGTISIQSNDRAR